MAKVVLIQGSLSKESRTAVVIQTVAEKLKDAGLDIEVLDLRNVDMDFCDGRPLKEYSSDLQEAYQLLDSADAFIFGMPVYCYSVSGPLKNFIDITSGAMEHKWAGIVCNAGGNRSFMSSADLIHILAYECHLTTLQPVIYSSYEDFKELTLSGEKVYAKIQELVDRMTPLLSKPS